jgi:hypothetical protein
MLFDALSAWIEGRALLSEIFRVLTHPYPCVLVQ